MKIFNRFTRYFIDKEDIDVDPVGTSVKSISLILELGGTNNFSGFKEKNWSILSVVLLVSTLGSFVYVGQASQWAHLVEQYPDKTAIIRALDCIVTCLIPLSDFFFIWIKRSDFKAMFTLTREGFSALPPAGPAALALRRTLRRGRLLTVLVATSFLSTHLLFVALPLIFSVVMGTNYFPEIPGEFIGLKPRLVSPNFELSYVFVTIGVYFSAVTVTGYTNIFITFTTHILGHIYGVIDTLSWLNDRIEGKHGEQENHVEIDKAELDKITTETLKFCIQRHQFILEYHSKLADLYMAIFGFHFLLMTIISVTTVQTYQDWGIINTAITASVSFMPLIMYCFGGEMVITASGMLAKAAYDSNWERMSPRNARTVLFMLAAAQRPINFTAASLFPLDVETFGTVMQTVYKVYAVIR